MIHSQKNIQVEVFEIKTIITIIIQVDFEANMKMMTKNPDIIAKTTTIRIETIIQKISQIADHMIIKMMIAHHQVIISI